MESVWWEKINKASLFTEGVTGNIENRENIILALPEYVPWYKEWTEIIAEELECAGFQNILKSVECYTEDPGKYVLENFCKKEIQSKYRVGRTYAEYLAQETGSALSSKTIWVKALNYEKLRLWLNFVREYRKKLPKNEPGAQFILEYRGSEPVKSYGGFKCISFDAEITAYDIYTFCALTCSDSTLDESLRPYVVELVSSVCGNDIELCDLCVRNGEEFAQDPEKFLTETAPERIRSDGNQFETEKLIPGLQQKIWECQIRVLFILVEKYRNRFISVHKSDIVRALPLETVFGDKIENPQDVELGVLYTLTQNGAILMRSNDEMPELKMYRDVRNDLAHLSTIPFETAIKILKT